MPVNDVRRRPAPVGAGLAWLRAGVLATVALVTGALAHVTADGLLPAWSTLLGLLVATTVLCRPWLDRPASTLRVVGLTVVGQTLLHGALTLTAGHTGHPSGDAGGGSAGPPPAPLPTPGGRIDPGVAADAAAAPRDVYGWHELLSDLTSPAAAMAALHLVAAILVGLWLAHGERVLWGAVLRAWDVLTGIGPVVRVVVGRARPAVLSAPGLIGQRLCALTDVVSRRGPPERCAA